MVTHLRFLPGDLRARMARWRQEGVQWSDVAGRLNTLGHLHITQRKPWTPGSAREWYRKHRGTRARQERRQRQQAKRLHVHRLVAAMYHQAREEPNRLQLVVDQLQRDGITTPTGRQPTTAWVSWVAEQEGVRVPAPRSSHWRSLAHVRPRTRADCTEGPRPCPWATCRHHMAPHLLASAERHYRNEANRTVPTAWAEAILAGDFGVLPHTCILDLVEDHGLADERGAMYAAIPDGSAIGRHLGITRELVRLDIKAAIRTIAMVEVDVEELLQTGYDASKLKPKEGR